MPSVSWTDTRTPEDREDGAEPDYHFQHPYPLDAQLYVYEGKWTCYVAWMEGGFEPGKEVHEWRENAEGMTDSEAQMWGTRIIREVLKGKARAAK